MKKILCRGFSRRNPFELEEVPWIVKIYRYPFDRWSTVGRQGLLGAHNFLAYFLYQKFFPFKIWGTFFLTIGGQKKRILFNPKNATYAILYFKSYQGGYEPQVAALMDLLLPENGVFYDIGSNWGWFSLMLASRPGFRGTIHAFEPYPPTYADLTSMFEQAGITGRAKAHNIALTDKKGSSFISLPDHVHSGCATIASESGSGTAAIQTTTLDDFCQDPPDIMKVDVEGFELQVFKGGKAAIQKHKPMIFFENKRDKEDIMQTMQPILALEELGYEFFHLAWLRIVDDKPCLIGDDLDPDPQAKETLAVVPIRSGERLLRHDLMNIFACHKDKLANLRAHFTEIEI